MILIAVGANLPNPRYGPPLATCQAVLPALDRVGLNVVKVSQWYESAPVPASSQPWYVNGVVALETKMDAMAVLDQLLALEEAFGRVRGQPNAARTLDLDLIAYDGQIISDSNADNPLILPHPRLHQRAFVLFPLADVAPGWHHPESGLSVTRMIEQLENPGAARVIRE